MWLWNKFLHISKLQNYNYLLFLLYGMVISILLVVLCCLIDKIYEKIEAIVVAKKLGK